MILKLTTLAKASKFRVSVTVKNDDSIDRIMNKRKLHFFLQSNGRTLSQNLDSISNSRIPFPHFRFPHFRNFVT